MAIGGTIGEPACIAKVEAGAVSIFIGIKEDVRSVIFVVTISLAKRWSTLNAVGTYSRAHR